MPETDVWLHVAQVESHVSSTVHRDADEAWIFRLAGCRIYEMHMSTELDVVYLLIGFEEVSHVQQGDLTHHRSIELRDLGCCTFLFA